MQTVSVVVKYIVKYINSSHFCVFKGIINDETSATTFVGNSSMVIKNETYTVTGDYVKNKYGIQFAYNSIVMDTSSAGKGVVEYLSSPHFKGVGKVAATKIVEKIGVDCIDKILNDPTILEQVNLTDKQVTSILTGLMLNDDGFNRCIQYLLSLDISVNKAHLIFAKFKGEAKEIIQQDPFAPYYYINDFDFLTCSKIATKLEFSRDSEIVLRAKIYEHIVRYCFNSGCTYISYDDLYKYCYNKYKIEEILIDSLLEQLIKEKLIVIDNNKVYIYQQYKAEFIIAHYLSNFANNPFKHIKNKDIDEQISILEKQKHIIYDQVQKEAIKAYFNNDISIISGGAGSGKTTIANAIVLLSKYFYHTQSIYAAAPTGRAAKRLSEVLHIHATTLHSLLGWDKHTNTFKKNELEPVAIDILIIDEFSMVDNILFASLCQAGVNIRKIVLIGDHNQLPSVGCGNLLKDLIESNIFTVTFLQANYRQKNYNDIVKLANNIINNDVNDDNFVGKVKYIECSDSEIVDVVNQVCTYWYSKYDDLNQLVVLSSMHDRSGGVKVLNQDLQNVFNGNCNKDNKIEIGYQTYYINDRILQIKNDNEQNVYNGDIGTIIDIKKLQKGKDKSSLEVIALFDDHLVSYTPNTYTNFTHAYAMTIHKAQGNEFNTVILSMPYCSSGMLNRNLIYTAVTRSKENLIIVGNKNAFIKGCGIMAINRKTTLIERLEYEKYIH